MPNSSATIRGTARRPALLALFALLCVFALLPRAAASLGDRLPAFTACVTRCVAETCAGTEEEVLPLHLRLLFWTCPQNCDYACQRDVTARRVAAGLSVEQFHGKWPFVRLAGVQEPLSVLFSVLNFVPHYKGLRALLALRRPSTSVASVDRLLAVYIGVAVTGMNAWTWSSVFHVRDFVLTERLDYFSAGLMVLYGFYTAAVRVFRLDRAAPPLRHALALACAAAYLAHVGYLQFVTFSYSYNMLANVVVGLLQNALWSYFAITQYRLHGDAWRLWPLGLVVSVSAAMSFELFDFPPVLDLLDAHALWHAGTVLPTYWWYNWMLRDIQSLKASKIKN